MKRTDLADPDNGILATLEEQVPLAVFQRDGQGEGARLELKPQAATAAVELHGELLGAWRIEARPLEGELVSESGSKKLRGLGALTEAGRAAAAQGDPPAGGDRALTEKGGAAAGATNGSDPAVIRRSITILFEDGALLALIAAGTAAAESHEDEETRAALCQADGSSTEFERALLSTEYSRDGTHRRATLELWPAARGAAPVRGAGWSIAETAFEFPGAISTIAYFEWSLNGKPGIGRYEIIRAG